MNRIIIILTLLVLTNFVNGQVYFRDNQYIFKNKVSIGSQSLTSTPTDAWFMVGDSASTKAMVLPRMQNASTLATPRQGMLTYSIADSSIYYWSLYNRYKIARINDILTYTANSPARITGTVISVDTSVAFSPSLATNARLKKIADSIISLGIGTPTLQQVITANSTLTTNNTISLGANQLLIDGNNSTSFKIDPSTAVGEFDMGSTGLFIDGINGTNTFKIAGTNYFKVDQNTAIHHFGQVNVSRPYIELDETFNANAGKITLYNTAVQFEGYPTANFKVDDTTNYKPTVFDASGNIRRFNHWPGSGSTYTANLPVRVTGTVISADTSVAYNPSLTSNQRLQKIIDSLSGAGSLSNSVNNNDAWYQYHYDQAGVTNANFYSSNSGTGSSLTRIDGVAGGWMTSFKWSLGTTTTGKTYGYMGNTGAVLYGAVTSETRFSFRARVRFEDLSDGTDTYKFWFGFMDDHFTPPASLLDGAYFTYTNGESSGVFVAHTESNGTETTSATATTVAADTDYLLEVTIFGGSAYFYINKTLAATISTNVPSGTARSTTPEIHIGKSAGTTSRDIYLDKIAYGMSQY